MFHKDSLEVGAWKGVKALFALHDEVAWLRRHLFIEVSIPGAFGEELVGSAAGKNAEIAVRIVGRVLLKGNRSVHDLASSVPRSLGQGRRLVEHASRIHDGLDCFVQLAAFARKLMLVFNEYYRCLVRVDLSAACALRCAQSTDA